MIKYLRNANLKGADLTNANLFGADLTNANLKGANLAGANLGNANLKGANLTGAILYEANLAYANLTNANLKGANLGNANLSFADLTGTNLINANLSHTHLNNADLTKAKLPEGEEIRKGIILKEDLIGFKKGSNKEIIELLIPKGNVVFSINNSECRTNSAKVLKITNEDGIDVKLAKSDYDNDFIYVVGETVEVEDFDLRYNVECSTGIHFFRTRKEAEEAY